MFGRRLTQKRWIEFKNNKPFDFCLICIHPIFLRPKNLHFDVNSASNFSDINLKLLSDTGAPKAAWDALRPLANI